MASSDPAVAAAQRAMPQSSRDLGYYPSRDSIRAAREAHATVRELHQRGDSCRCCAGWDEMNKPIVRYVCTGCTPGAPEYHHWPCATARLVYTSEELNRG